MRTIKMKDLINRFKGDYERYPIYEFKLIDGFYKNHKFLRYDYDSGGFVENDGEYSIIFIEDSHCPLFIWFEPPYHKNIIWSWAKNHNWGAHVENHPGGNAWHYMLRDGETTWGGKWGRYDHPNDFIKEYARAVHMKGSNSGTSVSRHICDAHIMNGLVRNHFTKEILMFPDKFNCMYCGELDWKQDERWIKYDSSVSKEIER